MGPVTARSRLPGVAGAIAAASVLAVMLRLGGPAATALVLACLALFGLPGVLLWRAWRPPTGLDGRAERTITGVVIGLGLGPTAVAGAAIAGGSAVGTTLALAAGAVALVVSRRPGAPPVRSIAARDDALFAALASAAVVLVAGTLLIPYASFGRVTARGLAFTELQKTDLLHHVVTTIELARGIPPPNPYFSGEVLHYYWWAHVLPGLAARLAGPGVGPRELTVLSALAYSLVASLAVLVALRARTRDPRVAGILLAMAVLASGYNALVALARWVVAAMPAAGAFGLGRLLTDDWGQEYTGYSHGLFRSFLVEPQSTLAVAMIAVALTLGMRHGFFAAGPRVALAQGALLGWTAATDAFLGALLGAAWALGGAGALVHGAGRRGRIARSLGAIAAAAGAMIALMLRLGMVRPGEPTLVLKPYLTLLAVAPAYFVMDYGPLALTGALGVALALRGRRQADETTRVLLLLAAVSVAAMFLVSHVQVGTQVFRKAALAARLALLLLSPPAVAWMLARRWARRLLAIAVLAAAPTLLTDVVRISGVGPLGDRVHYVSPQDAAAYAWMRAHVAARALVQELPDALPASIALGERRAALGDWVHAANYQIGEGRVRDRHQEVYRTLFMGRDAAAALAVAERLGIAYVYVGHAARRKMPPEAVGKFARCPGGFEPVYGAGGVTLYRVRPAVAGGGCG
ncbi:MAG TPA: DUF2298 domain-containing protein [Methylomirabilota bacterium]|jgi:hypothetical protein|nr:DUF2298 domain-containing protein [Methylomirabilota bacterium]